MSHTSAPILDDRSMRLFLPFGLLLAVVACGRGDKDVVVAPSVSRTADPAPPHSAPAAPRADESRSFRIHEGALLDDVFPITGQVLADGRVLVASGATESYGTALAILDAELRAWRILRTPDRPNWANPIGMVALGRTFAMVPQAYVGPNPSHLGGLLWDATGDKWTETGLLDVSAPDKVSGSSATVLRDGRVLVAAGVVTSHRGPPRVATRIWSKDRGTFDAAGDLVTARLEHTATVIHDGRVLVVGGKKGLGRNASVSSAELFDPATVKWTPAGDLRTARQGHTATLLPDGRVLVAGGNEGGKAPAPELEAWNPKTNTWSIVGRMGEPRTHHTATLLPNGRVLFIGGTRVAEDDLGYDSGYTRITNGEAAVTAEAWDPATGQSRPVVHPPSCRYDHVTVLLPDGRLLVIGGRLGTLAKKPQPMEIWEPSTKEDLRPILVMPAPTPLEGPLVPLDGGRVLALGAGELWDLDTNLVAAASKPPFVGQDTLLAPLGGGEVLATAGEHAARFAGGQWKEVPPPKRRYAASRAFDANGDDMTVTPLDADRVLFVGGDRGPKALGADVWSRLDEKFTDAGRPVRPRTRHTATLLDDGRVLVTGGQGETPPSSPRMPQPMAAPRGPLLRESELWDPKKKAFVATGALHHVRFDHAAVRLPDGRVLVTGGRNPEPLASVEAWSPKTSSWTVLAPMKTTRAAHTATLLPDGRVVVLGGDPENVPSTAEIYDPAANVWTTAGPLPELWTGHQAFLLRDGRVLVAAKRRSFVVSLVPH